jgi:sugar transferase (PEP-CTERM system associated)
MFYYLVHLSEHEGVRVNLFSSHTVSVKNPLMIGLDGVFIMLAVICGVHLRFWNSPAELDSYIRYPAFPLKVLIVVMTFQICFYYSNLYSFSAFQRFSRQMVSLTQSLGAGSLILGLAYFVFPGLLIGRGVFLISTFLIGIFVLASRMALEKAGGIQQNVLILGTQQTALLVAAELKHRDDLGLRFIGFVPGEMNGNHQPHNEPAEGPVLGSAAELQSVTAQYRISRIVVALEDRRKMLPIPELVKLRIAGILVEDAHTALSSLTGRVWLNLVQPSWFIFSDGFHRSSFLLMLKRVSDFLFAMAGLVLTSPIMALVAIAVRADSSGPILLRQTRVGLKGKPFQLLKFRSMCPDAEQRTGALWAQENDPRVTRVGKVLRKFRLDELPQFINVIRGDMSFVGPRPERPIFVEQLRQQIPYYEERHSVRPGLTGWAQVKYRYGSNIHDAARKLEYDLFYLKNMSLMFDILILAKTIRVVLTGRHGR